MAGKLDEISQAIGGLQAKFDALDYGIRENRRVADCRHSENKTRLEQIEGTLRSLVSDRNKVVIAISVVTGLIMWLATQLGPAILTKLGWK